MADELIRILRDRDVDAAIPEIIREADEFFTLVSPNTSFEGSWLSIIKNATQRGIEVCVVYNPLYTEESSNNHLINLPQEVKRYGVDYLHAKIYMTDKSVIITSMNYTNWSNKNREIAVRFERGTAQQAYEEVAAYVDELLGRIPDKNDSESIQRLKKTQGHCIFCGTNVSYDPQKPLCRRHWKPGLSDKPTIKHNYCHGCGKERETTFKEPRCTECHEQDQRDSS